MSSTGGVEGAGGVQSVGRAFEILEVIAAQGGELSLSEIVLAGDGKSFADAKGVSVKATVLGEGRSRKVLVFKKKRTKQYRRTKGHRQTFVELRIDAIEGV